MCQSPGKSSNFVSAVLAILLFDEVSVRLPILLEHCQIWSVNPLPLGTWFQHSRGIHLLAPYSIFVIVVVNIDCFFSSRNDLNSESVVFAGPTPG